MPSVLVSMDQLIDQAAAGGVTVEGELSGKTAGFEPVRLEEMARRYGSETRELEGAGK